MRIWYNYPRKGMRTDFIEEREFFNDELYPTMTVQRELPKYQCHKIVHALKIGDIYDPNNATDGSRLLSFLDEAYDSIAVRGDFMDKHNPQPGGYLVFYEDGYQSYSPAKAFEDGYTRI